MNWKAIRFIDIFIGIPIAYGFFYIKKLPSLRRQNTGINEYKKALFIKFWGIGNIIMLAPSVADFKKKHPGAACHLLTLASNKDAAVMLGVFDNVYCIDASGIFKFSTTLFKNIFFLRKTDYDILIDFEQFARFSALLCAMIGRKKTVGFDTRGQHRGFLYIDPVKYNNDIHMTRSFHSLVEKAAVPTHEIIPAIPLKCAGSDVAHAGTLTAKLAGGQKGPLVVMHAGTSKNFSLRRWPSGYFANLADVLIINSNARIILTGAKEERELTNEIFGMIKNRRSVINAAGQLTFGQFAALIKESAFTLSADTSTVHIASSLGIPIAAFYGPNTPVLYGPWNGRCISFYKNITCSPCITNFNAKINTCDNPAGEGECMKKIRVDEVFDALKKNHFL